MLQANSDRQRTPNATYYISDDVLGAERETIFFNSWQFAGHISQVASPGDFVTTSIFDQNILIVRGQDNEIRAFYNVCPHRGHQLVEGEGNKRVITCPYHAWTFGLEGNLRGLKKGANTATPDRAEVCLSSIRVDQLAGFLFVNLNPDAPTLAEFAPGLEEQILTTCPELPDLVLEEGAALGHTYECGANWKVLLDNYLECHHCGPAHDSFNDMMDIANSKFELFENYTYQIAPTAQKTESKAFPLDLEHDVTVGHFWFLFPNTVFGQFPGTRGFYISRFDPVTPDLTQRRTLSLITAEPTDLDMMRRHKLRSDWSVNVVSQEDRALCENVQRGMHQRGYQQGWYITDPDEHGISEHAMRYFHDLYLAALEG